MQKEKHLLTCSVGGNPVAEKVADIMGVNAANVERKVATVLCQGDCNKARKNIFTTELRIAGLQNILQGGSKACSYGCLGCGTCKEVYQFGAIEMRDGVAFILKDKCTACMKCIEVCPKKIIELVPYENEYVVKCMSKDSGKK